MTQRNDKSRRGSSTRPERMRPAANARIKVGVLFDDGHVLALAKPAGLATQPGRGHLEDTLVNAAFATHGEALQSLGAERDWGLLHRLDRDVAGVVLMGLTPRGYDLVRSQFEDRTITKRYLAAVQGAPPSPTGQCTRELEEVIRGDMKVSVHRPHGGESAVTRWRTIARSATHTLLEVEPLTGRLHQIRAHLAMVGCPVVGDRVYRVDLPPNTSPLPPGRTAPPLLLLAWQIEFTGVDGRRHLVRCRPGPEWAAFAAPHGWTLPD